MSEETTETTTDDQATGQTTETPVTEAEATETDQTTETPNAEAKKYRLKLREAEARLEKLQATVSAYQTREIETLAGEAGMQSPTDLWTQESSIEAFLSEDGAIDPEAVQSAVSTLLEARPHWKSQKAIALPGKPTGKLVPGHSSEDPDDAKGASWGDVLRRS
ncbi:MAG: hypothetical protein GEU93_11190 [Propionibacteriales bacterium]|nr:hypothetical protein [Propionibacteriales bacterium]